MLANPPPDTVASIFFRLQQRPLNDPLDSDGDGIDDVYELRHATILNPLDASDANQSPQGQSLTHLQSYRLVKAAAQTRSFSNAGRRFAASAERVAAIRDDGTLWAWGKNDDGRLGDGTLDQKTSPVRIGSGSEWVSVSSSAKHSVALRADGSIWAWGANEAGQLGFSDLQPRLTPTQVPGTAEWKSVSAGGSQTLAIQQDGTLWVWGGYGRGPTSAIKVDDSKTWRTVAAAVISYGLGIKDDGTLWLIPGEGSNPIIGAKPPSQIGDGSNWVEVAIGFGHYLAIDKDRRLVSWGDNTFGQLGDGTHSARTFANRKDLGTGWNFVSAGAFSSLAVKQDGTLWFFGGALGPGAIATSFPVQVATGHSWAQAASQDLGIVAADTQGVLWNLSAKIGNMNEFGDARVIGTDDDWVAVIEGDASSFGIKKDGRAYGWGWNDNGQLGVGLQTNRVVSPQLVGDGTAWTSIVPHQDFTVGLTKGDAVYAWGNVLHVLGAGIWDTNILQPTLLSSNAWPLDVPTGQTNASGIAHFIRLAPPTNQPAARPELTLWGDNQFGQLGNGGRTSQPAENPVNLGINWSEVAAGENYSLAKNTIGQVYGWGELLPLLGSPKVPVNYSPTPIDHRFAALGEGNSELELAAASSEHLQVRGDGSLWAVGENSQGQAGDGTIESRENPVPVVAYPPAKLFQIFKNQIEVDLDIVHPSTGLVAETKEDDPGGLVAVSGPHRPVTKLVVAGMGRGLKGSFTFSHTPLVNLWLNQTFTQPLPVVVSAEEDLTIYVEGVERSRTMGDQSVNVQWVGNGIIARSSDSVTLTVIEPEITFVVDSFIPYVWTDPNIPLMSFIAVGDGRSFAFPDNPDATFRLRQEVTINPYEDLVADGIVSHGRSVRAGNSTHYTKNAIPPSSRSDLHGDCCLNPAPAWLLGDGPANIVEDEVIDLGTRESSGRPARVFNCAAAGIDGAVNLALTLGGLIFDGTIWWNIEMRLETDDPLHPKYAVLGRRKQFPAYEMYVSFNAAAVHWQPVFQWKPPLSRTVFDNLPWQEPIADQPLTGIIQE